MPSACEGDKRHVTLVHKGNIMKFTEGAFRDWGYELATSEFRDQCVTERESWILDNLAKDPGSQHRGQRPLIDPGYDASHRRRKRRRSEVKGVIDAIGESHGDGKWKSMVMVDDRIADSIFQQIQTRPQEYSVLCTLNLNGDYISDAAAAVVGGLGMAPGANIGDKAAIFEATHGTAPKHAGLDRINPGSVILSGVMMLEYMGWQEAADLITAGHQRRDREQGGHLRPGPADGAPGGARELLRLRRSGGAPLRGVRRPDWLHEPRPLCAPAAATRHRSGPPPVRPPPWPASRSVPLIPACIAASACPPVPATGCWARDGFPPGSHPRPAGHPGRGAGAGRHGGEAFRQLPGLLGLCDRLPLRGALRRADRSHPPPAERPGTAQPGATGLSGLLFALLPYPARLRALLAPLRSYAGTPLQALARRSGLTRLFGPQIAAMERLLPALPPRRFRTTGPC
jgi:hypothetical protein